MISQRLCEPSGQLKIDEEVYGKIVEEVTAAYPREACGMLLASQGSDRVNEMQGLNNQAGGMESHWYHQVDPMELYRLELRAEMEGKRILGFYHSHPDASADFSREDEKYFIPGMAYLILPIHGNEVGIARAYEIKTPDDQVSEMEVCRERV